MTEAGALVYKYLMRKGICTSCHRDWAKKGCDNAGNKFYTCEKCYIRKDSYKKRNSRKIGRPNDCHSPWGKKKPKKSDAEQQRIYKKKKLYEKVRKLDRIRHAVETGKEL
jgi:hypothetical protein